jgi:hypothetical protein
MMAAKTKKKAKSKQKAKGHDGKLVLPKRKQTEGERA